jgi:hypothetical protein
LDSQIQNLQEKQQEIATQNQKSSNLIK